MENKWFASWECKENGIGMKMSGVFTTSTNDPVAAYDEVKSMIKETGKITDIWIVSFNKI